MSPNPSPRSIPPSAFWGSMLGCTLWAVLLIGVFVTRGYFELAWSVGVPCLALGIGAGLSTAVAIVRVGRPFAFGLLALQVGALLLLGNAWVLPALDEAGWNDAAHPAFRAQGVPHIVVVALLVVGCGLLIYAWRHCGNASAPSGGGDTPSGEEA